MQDEKLVWCQHLISNKFNKKKKEWRKNDVYCLAHSLAYIVSRCYCFFFRCPVLLLSFSADSRYTIKQKSIYFFIISYTYTCMVSISIVFVELKHRARYTIIHLYNPIHIYYMLAGIESDEENEAKTTYLRWYRHYVYRLQCDAIIIHIRTGHITRVRRRIFHIDKCKTSPEFVLF